MDFSILANLGLTTPLRQFPITSTTGSTITCGQFNVSLTIVHPVLTLRQNLVLASVPILQAPLGSLGIQVIVGCDILRQCLFAYDGPSCRFILAY